MMSDKVQAKCLQTDGFEAVLFLAKLHFVKIFLLCIKVNILSHATKAYTMPECDWNLILCDARNVRF